MVVDEAGEPIWGAEVFHVTPSGGPTIATTDQRGEAQIPRDVKQCQQHYVAVIKEGFEREPSLDLRQPLPLRVVLVRQPQPGSQRRAMLLEILDERESIFRFLLTHHETTALLEDQLKSRYQEPEEKELPTLSKKAVLMVSEPGDVEFHRPPERSYSFYETRLPNTSRLMKPLFGEKVPIDLWTWAWRSFLPRARTYTGPVRSALSSGKK